MSDSPERMRDSYRHNACAQSRINIATLAGLVKKSMAKLPDYFMTKLAFTVTVISFVFVDVLKTP